MQKNSLSNEVNDVEKTGLFVEIFFFGRALFSSFEKEEAWFSVCGRGGGRTRDGILVGNLGDSVGEKSVGGVGMRNVDAGIVCEGEDDSVGMGRGLTVWHLSMLH